MSRPAPSGVVGEFPNPDRLLVPGMFVRVRAQIGMNKNALLVPQQAVAEMQGRNLIAVVGADNKVEHPARDDRRNGRRANGSSQGR